ncbi:MAG: energy transducer TonB [Gammaproteobacteria bacterium]|nr:energy transducer TonB [Gammaproteobacteria bacterium]
MNGNELLAALPAAALSEYCLRRLDRFSIGLIEHAARQAPPALSQRLHEEWLADLAGRRGYVSRLRLALGCWWAAQVIARECGIVGVAAVGSGKAVAYAPHAPQFLSRRTVALLLITCLHLTLIYLLAIGMEHKTVSVPPAPIIYDVKDEPVAHQPPPPPAAPRFATPKFDPVEPQIPIESSADGSGISGPAPERLRDPGTPASAEIDRVPGGPGEGFPNTADYYPDSSRRLGEKGVASVQVCVDAGGRLTSDPSILRSSGNSRLDSGALTLARAGSGHYRPTLENGRAVSSCFPFRIRFEFRD